MSGHELLNAPRRRVFTFAVALVLLSQGRRGVRSERASSDVNNLVSSASRCSR